MGQKTSCLSSESKSSGYKTVDSELRPYRSNEQRVAPTRFNNVNDDKLNNKGVRKGSNIRTRTTESDCEDENLFDRKSGYILVDLKGDKVVHIEQDYLIGCEIYAPGLGIGWIIAYVSDNKFAIHYKVQYIVVQMADGRHVVVAVRRCEDNQVADMSILNTRIFIMQRLY